MSIINNIYSSHFQELKLLAENSDELILVSPFCYENFDCFFDHIIREKIKKLTFITTLKSQEAISKCKSFMTFREKSKSKNINWQIAINN